MCEALRELMKDEIEKRIKEDKRHPGVIMEMSKSEAILQKVIETFGKVSGALSMWSGLGSVVHNVNNMGVQRKVVRKLTVHGALVGNV